MNRKWATLALLLAAGTALPGCVAVIPAVAGSAVFGSRVADGGEESAPAPKVAAAAPAPLPKPAPSPKPAVPAPTPALRPVVPAVTAASAPATRPAVVPGPQPVAAPVPPPASPPADAPAPAAPLATYPDPDRPIPANQANFARFVRYTAAAASQAARGADVPSAVLSDPVALDGKRRRCVAGEQLVAVIDLDPVSGPFAPPAVPSVQPGLALGLSVLRDAGVEIAWVSNLSTNQSGAVRTALEQSGLDPRGQDIISLSRDDDDSKQKRKDNLAGITCIVAIAGDERTDFDMRFKYLRSPEAGSGIEPLIGDGWFLIAPLLGN